MSDNRKHVGRPSSGLYGTIKDRAAYQRAYREKNPRKRLEYRLRQAVNLIHKHGGEYGITVQVENTDTGGDDQRGEKLNPR